MPARACGADPRWPPPAAPGAACPWVLICGASGPTRPIKRIVGKRIHVERLQGRPGCNGRRGCRARQGP
eukprot:1941298-Lingulodinium_polyedra.AAC.1